MDRKKRTEGPKLHVPKALPRARGALAYGIWTRKRKAPKSVLTYELETVP